jgi:hypothetical protein
VNPLRRMMAVLRLAWVAGSLMLLVMACIDDGWGWLQIAAVVTNMTSVALALDMHERRFDRRQRYPSRNRHHTDQCS